MKLPLASALVALLAATTTFARGPSSERWLEYPANAEHARSQHVVLIAGDQEYRSEQAIPMLARILSTKHGLRCTVLFAVNAEGQVDPTGKTYDQDKSVVHDVPGLEQLEGADLLVLFTRFLHLPEEQERRIVDYVDSGRPILAIRTANHGFLPDLRYEVDGERVRFGEDVLGGTFRGHHGGWHHEATRGIVVESAREHPILRGVDDVFGPTDVYRTYPEGGSLPAGCTALLLGQPLVGLDPSDPPNPAKEPLPIAWTKTYTGSKGVAGRVFHCTMGSARDYLCEDLRRLTLNAALWCLGLEAEITPDLDVELVGPYEPLESGFDYERLGVRPRPVEEYR